MNKSGSSLAILVPALTAFFSGGCIMILELVAGRLIARHLGSSLYTWTSVIGVVLAGITIGNYLGGRIADRFTSKKALATLFGIASVTCVAILVMNNLVGHWRWLYDFAWPARIFAHVCLVFLIPSALLGTISPVVAKMALDKNLATGKTVGTIYAAGAAGSIAGTFLAGFYLIAAIGITAIICTIAGVLVLIAILYYPRFWILYVWAAILAAVTVLATAQPDWAKFAGAALALRTKPDPDTIYETESQYSYIAVRLSPYSDEHELIVGRFPQSGILMADPTSLQAHYERIYAAVTRKLSRRKDTFATLSIGGGGYVFPRYLEHFWPQSRIDVIEIDPAVTEAAICAFGLDPDTTINTFNIDARNYVDSLLQERHAGGPIKRYDFIYGDAFCDFAVPFHLVTKEFNDKIARILSDDGVYLLNLIDVFDSGLFLSAAVNTLYQSFRYVYVLSSDRPTNILSNFVAIASKRPVDIDDIADHYELKNSFLWILDETDIQTLTNKTEGLVLTDDYAPVENLFAPAIRITAPLIQQAVGRLLWSLSAKESKCIRSSSTTIGGSGDGVVGESFLY
jgi:predicted membrane-bound spermidine synthase